MKKQIRPELLICALAFGALCFLGGFFAGRNSLRPLDAVLAGRRLFDRPDRPDAVMVSSGILVKSIVVQALQRGVRIPADASIVAFGTNDWEAYKFVPRLTAVERNYAGIIEAGVAMLCELMDKGAVQVPQVTVPERFSIRDSTANRLA